jgi:hypothetical protein
MLDKMRRHRFNAAGALARWAFPRACSWLDDFETVTTRVTMPHQAQRQFIL